MKPLHFLVTDDDVEKRLLIVRALSREFPKASIYECHSGQEALDYFFRNPVDALVTNHSMFPVNGIELVRELRSRGSQVPIIMISNHDELQAEAEAVGVDLFIGGGSWNEVGTKAGRYLHARGFADQVEG